MGTGLDPLDPAPGHYYHTDPVRPTRLRATPPDARDIGAPSTGRRAYSKLIGTLSFWASGTLKIVIYVENYPQRRSFWWLIITPSGGGGGC